MTSPSAPLRLLSTAAVFLILEAAIFRSDLYPSILEPDSSTGTVETRLRNERERKVSDRKQILSVGHSRMGVLPKIANELEPPTGYTFASIAEPGATQRDWYYMLRNVDPDTNRYAAIVIPSDDYEDTDGLEDLSDRITDLYYLNARLELRDLFEFPRSYASRDRQVLAFRGVLLKGLAYQRDFQEFILHPKARLDKVNVRRGRSAADLYNYKGEVEDVQGLEIDWAARKVIQYPPGWTPAQQEVVRNVLLSEPAPQTGRLTRYLAKWIGKIVDRYQGSGTKLIFIQLPRAPLIRPDQSALKPDSAFRVLAKRPDVYLSDAHLFDELERPDLFHDPLHLNAPGMKRFTEILARHVQRVLGDGR